MTVTRIKCHNGSSINCTGRGEMTNIYGVMMCAPCLFDWVENNVDEKHYKVRLQQLGIETLEDWN